MCSHRLIIGLGGAALVAELSFLLPEANIDVVEIDPVSLELAKTFFSFDESKQVKVVLDEGAAYVKKLSTTKSRYDLIIIDVFDDEYIPEHLITTQFIGNLKAILYRGGVVAMNTFASSSIYALESQLFAEEFGAVYNLVDGNGILIAVNGALPDIKQVRLTAAKWNPFFKSLEMDRDKLLAAFKAEYL